MRLRHIFSAVTSPLHRPALLPSRFRMHPASADRSPQEEPRPKRRRLESPDMALPTPTIALTAEEELVRKLLVDAAAYIDSELPAAHDGERLELRFTGGWVRDKLLGEQCHDIDVGINKMTGFDFATRLGSFLTDRQADYNIPTRNIHKIESNPEKSKHLETATTKIMGLDIDFVNLRSETYTDDSRIPQMVCGPPCRIVWRRLTIVPGVWHSRPRCSAPRCMHQCSLLQYPHTKGRRPHRKGPARHEGSFDPDASPSVPDLQ